MRIRKQIANGITITITDKSRSAPAPEIGALRSGTPARPSVAAVMRKAGSFKPKIAPMARRRGEEQHWHLAGPKDRERQDQVGADGMSTEERHHPGRQTAERSDGPGGDLSRHGASLGSRT